MPRLSVVVPIYQVERYLASCLQSLARQTYRDFEVVMVDDGSTDQSVAIAESVAEHDARFHFVTQANGGLGKARNTGLAAASGEFVAFVDSDDVVADDAYARLVGALDSSGSDFATGNVQRLTAAGVSQAHFLSAAFARTRMGTHVSKFRPLLADRTAWNKLFRRAFWDEHAGQFPEGVVHEDIPVILPAHLAAARVDVLAAPVYRYRIRDDGEQSITQRRLEQSVLRDRLAAIESVRSYFAAHASRKVCRWYDVSVLGDDLRRHLVLLDQADAAYRKMFFQAVRPILDALPFRHLRGLRAIDRLKWHLIARGLEDELLEVLRFEREQHGNTPAARRWGRFYGDYPFRGDRRLRIPRSVFRLSHSDPELALVAAVDGLSCERGVLQLRGHAYVPGVDAIPQTIALALPPGRFQALRLRTLAIPLRTLPLHRPELGPAQETARDLSWSGFDATVDTTALLAARGRRARRWKLFLRCRAGKVRRRRGVFEVESPELIRTVDLRAPARFLARARISAGGSVTVEARRNWARLEGPPAARAGVLELALELSYAAGPGARLRLKRRSDALELSYPLIAQTDAGPLRRNARLPLTDLYEAPPSLEALASPDSKNEIWDLWLHAGSSALAIAISEGLAGAVSDSERRLLAIRTQLGNVAFVICRAAEFENTAGAVSWLRALERTTTPASLRTTASAHVGGLAAAAA